MLKLMLATNCGAQGVGFASGRLTDYRGRGGGIELSLRMYCALQQAGNKRRRCSPPATTQTREDTPAQPAGRARTPEPTEEAELVLFGGQLVAICWWQFGRRVMHHRPVHKSFSLHCPRPFCFICFSFKVFVWFPGHTAQEEELEAIQTTFCKRGLLDVPNMLVLKARPVFIRNIVCSFPRATYVYIN